MKEKAIKNQQNSPKTRSSKEQQKGATMVEFAVILVFFFFLLGGIIDFGVTIFKYSLLTNVVTEKARDVALSCITEVNAEIQAKDRLARFGVFVDEINSSDVEFYYGPPPTLFRPARGYSHNISARKVED